MKKIRKSDSRDGVYLITPADAAQILAEMKQNSNRALSEFHARRISVEMSNGHYRYNGQAIIFDEWAEPLDGQHRLRACVIANKPFETHVVFGVPRNRFDLLDMGKKRLAGDVLSKLGFKHYLIAAAVARYDMLYERGYLDKTKASKGVKGRTPSLQPQARGSRLSNYEFTKYAKKNEGPLQAAVEDVCGYGKSLGRMLPISGKSS